MMQPCLKKKSTGKVSEGEKKSQGDKTPSLPKEELKVEGSVAGSEKQPEITAPPEEVPAENEEGPEEEDE